MGAQGQRQTEQNAVEFGFFFEFFSFCLVLLFVSLLAVFIFPLILPHIHIAFGVESSRNDVRAWTDTNERTDCTNTDSLLLLFLLPMHRFYHEEQQVRKHVKLDGFIDNVEIKVLIHGYVSSRYHISIEPIKQAYLSAGNVNLMIVDWSQASYQLYGVSRRITSQVAFRIAQMLDDFLRDNNINGDSVHLIGHSLGAHIAGNIGRMMSERVGR